jgi:uncharacterized protein (TIGR00251 family)
MIILIKTTPNASNNCILGMQGGALRVKVAAQPDKGKANDELIDFLSEEFDVPKSKIRILSGHTSRLKRLEIEGLDEAAFRKRFP